MGLSRPVMGLLYLSCSRAKVKANSKSRNDLSRQHSRISECICSRYATSRLQCVGMPELAVFHTTMRSESRCALRLQCVDLVVSIEVAVEVCCCFTVFSC
jgi:hypothetical protein